MEKTLKRKFKAWLLSEGIMTKELSVELEEKIADYWINIIISK